MWTHKQHKGKYAMKVVIANGDKAYQIKTDKKKITHESWQQFKKNGWVKV